MAISGVYAATRITYYPVKLSDDDIILVPHNIQMSSPGSEITHVSDTALMVAACRAHENEQEDA